MRTRFRRRGRLGRRPARWWSGISADAGRGYYYPGTDGRTRFAAFFTVLYDIRWETTDRSAFSGWESGHGASGITCRVFEPAEAAGRTGGGLADSTLCARSTATFKIIARLCYRLRLHAIRNGQQGARQRWVCCSNTTSKARKKTAPIKTRRFPGGNHAGVVGCKFEERPKIGLSRNCFRELG